MASSTRAELEQPSARELQSAEAMATLGLLPRDRRCAARRPRRVAAASRRASPRRLAAEPTVLAPRPRVGRAAAPRWAWAAAATVAAVTVVGWTALLADRAPPTAVAQGRARPPTVRAAQVAAATRARRLPARAPGILAGDGDAGRRPVPARRRRRRQRRRTAAVPLTRAAPGDTFARSTQRAARRARAGRPCAATGRCCCAASGCARRGRCAVARARRARRRAQLNYVGTIVYQHGGRVETSRLVHIFDERRRSPRSW